MPSAKRTGGGFDLSYAAFETPLTIDVSTLASAQSPQACGDSTHFDASNMKQVKRMHNDQTVGMDLPALAPNQANTCNLLEEGPTTAGIDAVPKQEGTQP